MIEFEIPPKNAEKFSEWLSVDPSVWLNFYDATIEIENHTVIFCHYRIHGIIEFENGFPVDGFKIKDSRVLYKNKTLDEYLSLIENKE